MTKNPFPCLGHVQAIRAFEKSLEKKRLPTAFLILGPRGVGKKSYGYHCAWHLLSQSFPDAMHTALTQQMKEKTAEGFFVCSGHTIECVHLLKKYLQKTLSMQKMWRIVLVPRIDQMTPGAMAALLKVIEEPPERTLFFLTARTLGPLSEPLISRCQKISLRPLSPEVFNPLGEKILTQAGMQPSSKTVLSLYTSAQGCLGIAQDLVDSEEKESWLFCQKFLNETLLPSDHPNYVSPFDVTYQDFWSECDIVSFYEDFEFFLSDLLIRRALQEHLTQEEQLISGRLSPEGWSRFLSQLKTMIHDVATYHLSPLQFAPCFFHLNPYRSF